MKPLRIVSRGSSLARWQSRAVGERLRALGAPAPLFVEVRTTGDQVTDVPLAQIGSRGLFTKEVDEVLLRGDGEIAVHSLKDLPTSLPEGLTLAAVLEREDPRDALLVAPGIPGRLTQISAGSRVGTSSLRRRALLGSVRPDLEVVDLRGNLDTRMRRLERGDYDAILVASAGVSRLGMAERIAERLDASTWLPAVGQGALAVVCRENDGSTLELVGALTHSRTRQATDAERSFLAELEGGCQVPIAALASFEGEALRLRACVASLNGSRILRAEGAAEGRTPAELGRAVAADLLAQGAAGLLEEVRRETGFPAPAPPAP